MTTRVLMPLICALSASVVTAVRAQSHEEELAKKLANPVASLISVPIQLNYDERFGAARQGHKLYANVQPVVPFSLNAEWNLISRTILPIVDQSGVVPGTSQAGIGDLTQSLFFSPAQPRHGVIWAVGPVFLLPTGSRDELSARKWGLGPTALLFRQEGGWTYGVLANHLWGVGGDSDRPNLSSTFVQPVVSHTTRTAWTYSLNAESTYDWKNHRWSVPINATVAKLLKVGEHPLSIGGGVRYWATGPESGPHGWGYRLVVTFLFPK